MEERLTPASPSEVQLPAGAVGSAPAATLAPRPARTVSIDIVRGAVMVLMVLDHARDFFFGLRPRPTDLDHTTVILFFTRWMTHFCAPVFVFLAGTSAYLYGTRHGRGTESRYLLVRGFFLVLLEVTVIRMGWIPDPGYHFTVIQVIWALGWSMVALAGLSRLPLPAVLAVGAAMVAGQHLLEPIDHMNLGALGPLWTILHARGRLQLVPGHFLFVTYPLVPWIGVMALGYGFGKLFDRPAPQRRPVILRAGAAMVVAFIILRASNLYGDPTPWASHARGAVYTVLSFINCEKYPPSLAYLLMTLGPALCVLALLDRDDLKLPRAAGPLLVFGRVPLLFYVAHLYLLRYSSAPFAFFKWGPSGFQPPPGHAGSPEFGLWSAYLAWALALLLLYPMCRWFVALKSRRRDWWSSYL